MRKKNETETENSDARVGRVMSPEQLEKMKAGRAAANKLNASLAVVSAPKTAASELKPIAKIQFRKIAVDALNEHLVAIFEANPHLAHGKVVKGTLKLLA